MAQGTSPAVEEALQGLGLSKSKLRHFRSTSETSTNSRRAINFSMPMRDLFKPLPPTPRGETWEPWNWREDMKAGQRERWDWRGERVRVDEKKGHSSLTTILVGLDVE
jgi:hypothetical protein